jgi:hypothetical protein
MFYRIRFHFLLSEKVKGFIEIVRVIQKSHEIRVIKVTKLLSHIINNS